MPDVSLPVGALCVALSLMAGACQTDSPRARGPSDSALPVASASPTVPSTPFGTGGAAAAPANKVPQQPTPEILARFCPTAAGPAPAGITVLRDASGKIGGYVYSGPIMDSPVSYLDAQGVQVAMFHIFGSDEEKKRNAPIIEALRAAYPLQAPLSCPPRSK